VLDHLNAEGLLEYVSLDLGQLQSLNYYSGITFKGFTYGLGFPLFSGGRYDQLVANFGRDLSATGFSIGLNLALQALRRQGKKRPQRPTADFIGYHPTRQAAAMERVRQLRRQGRAVICDYDSLSYADLERLARTDEYASVLYLPADRDELETIDPGLPLSQDLEQQGVSDHG
jgi:ATP phosphoribosyltransferase regulatory subunit